MNTAKKILLWFVEKYNLKPVVKEGTTRIVWIFPRYGFVLKFPIIYFNRFVKTLRQTFNPKCTEKKYRKLVLQNYFAGPENDLVGFRFHVLKGLMDNWREFLFYLRCWNNGFTLPTYFSFLGLINIQRFGKEVPDEANVHHYFYDATDGECNSDDHHFGEEKNFCYHNGRLMIRDYGGKLTQKIVLKYLDRLKAVPGEPIE